MKFYLVFFIIYTTCLLTGCSNSTQKQGVAETESTKTSGGGADTGGSNSIDGKAIESYIVDLENDARTSDAYKNYIFPILTKIDKVLPSFSDELRQIFSDKSQNKRRTWYILPGQLQQLDNHTIAIPSDVRTEQTALHTKTSIYISELSYSKIPIDEIKAKHIVHEAIMAMIVDAKRMDKEAFISADDYENIRFLTDFLFSKSLEKIKSDEFVTLLLLKNVHGLRNFYFPEPIDQKLNFGNASQLYNFLNQRAVLDSHISYILPYFTSSDEVCSYKFNPNKKQMNVDFGSESITFQFEEIIEYTKNHSSLEIVVLDFDDSQKKLATALHIQFEGNTINYFEFSRKKLINDSSSMKKNWKDFLDTKFNSVLSCHSTRVAPSGIELVN
ncbi:MAG: hypothetical protein V4596_10910 [Bdellovibrionota bacterium]